jgi:hypothetical protein
MTIHIESLTEDLEDEGRVKTAVVGVRYTGPRSSAPPDTLRRQGGWPGDTPFQGGEFDAETGERQPGPIQIGINPDWIDDDVVDGGTVAGLEALGNFEVIYDPEPLAAALLDRNFLPPNAFGGEGISYDPPVRRALFGHLGLDDAGTLPAAAQDYREQLAAIAGLDDIEEETPIEDKQRTQRYLDDHTRAELVEAVKLVRDSSEEIALGGQTKHDLAEFLAERDPARVNDALDEVAG